MKNFLLLLVVALCTLSCCKKDDTPDYRSEEATYMLRTISNGEPITSADLVYSFFNGKEMYSDNFFYVAETIKREPTTLFRLGKIKGEVRATLAITSSSDNAKITLQLLRNGAVIKEETKQGKTFSLEVSN